MLWEGGETDSVKCLVNGEISQDYEKKRKTGVWGFSGFLA
jgi:hypothetical protein